MRPVLIALTEATAASLVYGTLVESPSVTYYIAVAAFLVGAVGHIHCSVHSADVTLWALALAAIGNLAGGVLLVGGPPLRTVRRRFNRVRQSVSRSRDGNRCLGLPGGLEHLDGQSPDGTRLRGADDGERRGRSSRGRRNIGTLLREKTEVGGYPTTCRT